jgi:hypothetical protein
LVQSGLIAVSTMLIPAQTPPLLSRIPGDSDARERQYKLPTGERSVSRRPDSETAEYIHRGRIDDDDANADRAQRIYGQGVDPANRSALLSYAITESSALGQPARVGRYLDLFL